MITKKTALKICTLFALYYALLFAACNLHAQSGEVIQMRFPEGIIEAGNINEHRIYIKYTPIGEHSDTDPDSITVSTYRFCPEKYNITEKFGTTIWLSSAGSMKYSEFLKEYMKDNNRDARLIYEHAVKLSDGLDRHFPATVLRQLRISIDVTNRNKSKF